jgi:hypothetical protein
MSQRARFNYNSGDDVMSNLTKLLLALLVSLVLSTASLAMNHGNKDEAKPADTTEEAATEDGEAEPGCD